MVRRRYRTLSVQGLELFCDSMNINSDTNKYIESKKNCKNLKIYEKLKVKHKQIKQFLQNIFSSDYDKQLEKELSNPLSASDIYYNENRKYPNSLPYVYKF